MLDLGRFEANTNPFKQTNREEDGMQRPGRAEATIFTECSRGRLSGFEAVVIDRVVARLDSPCVCHGQQNLK